MLNTTINAPTPQPNPNANAKNATSVLRVMGRWVGAGSCDICSSRVSRRKALPGGHRTPPTGGDLIQLTTKAEPLTAPYTATHSDRAHRLIARLSPTDQRHLRRILAHLAESLTETSAAEAKPLDLDHTPFRGNRAAPTKEP